MTDDPAVSSDPRAWIGRAREAVDRLHGERVAALWAVLDRAGPPPGPGEALPPLWHWLFFWEISPRRRQGPDGHPAPGDFLPALAGMRRMWAGSRVTFHKPLLIGSELRRRSTIRSVEVKEGRSGRLVFVTVAHRLSDAAGPALTDEHDIVYRPPPRPGAVARPLEPAPATAMRVEQWQADPSLLFRYSALTFNGHRIHYDQAYAREREGYPGLVVHGPLLATLMAGAALALDPARPLEHFAFRALAPVFADEPFTVMADADGAVWTRRADGALAARGEALRGAGPG